MNTDSRNKILASVRANRPAGIYHLPSVRVFAELDKPETNFQDFKTHLKEAYADWYETATAEEASELLHRLHPGNGIICSAAPEIAGTRAIRPTDDPHTLADVDVGVVRARFGVAENGAVWITGQDLIVHSLGFLPQHLIVLLDPEQIVADMHEAYKRVAINQHNYGCFMMGPSATADISATLVKGAQGVRSLNVFFLKEKQSAGLLSTTPDEDRR